MVTGSNSCQIAMKNIQIHLKTLELLFDWIHSTTLTTHMNSVRILVTWCLKCDEIKGKSST